MVSPTVSPARYEAFDHVTWWVGNAKQAVTYWCVRFGFDYIAYSGLETGARDVASHVVRKNNVTFVLQSPLNPNDPVHSSHHALHGDGVKDVAFQVDDAAALYHAAVKRGAKGIREPWTQHDKDGQVIMATIATYGDTEHTFVERKNYKGTFLPGFMVPKHTDPLASKLGDSNLLHIDHCVGNQPDQGMLPAVRFYEEKLGFHRFWSVDDKDINTEFSALRSIVMADESENVKMPINEPAAGKKKSQIQEYVDYYGGSGVQHIALRTEDIISAVSTLRDRGVEFLKTPDTYYKDLKARLARSSTKIVEDMDILRSLNILVDFDEGGYLLQIFSKPVSDRPTVFIEVIQRRGHQGFGAGNFKALFEAIERDQEERGNL